jgi:hypothetical protein
MANEMILEAHWFRDEDGEGFKLYDTNGKTVLAIFYGLPDDIQDPIRRYIRGVYPGAEVHFIY